MIARAANSRPGPRPCVEILNSTVIFDSAGGALKASMPRYQNAKGVTTEEDLHRLVWYGPCGYWTDRWDQLSLFNGQVPCCPKCHAVGFQETLTQWLRGAVDFEATHPRYAEFIVEVKEQCFKGVKAPYEAWVAAQAGPPGPDLPDTTAAGSAGEPGDVQG
jgi:hypothetical protein